MEFGCEFWKWQVLVITIGAVLPYPSNVIGNDWVKMPTRSAKFWPDKSGRDAENLWLLVPMCGGIKATLGDFIRLSRQPTQSQDNMPC